LNLNDQLLAALTLYGLPVLLGATFFNSIGIPIPANIMLIAAGSFIELGDMNLWWVIILCSIGAILGDQVDYAIGLWGGRRLTAKISGWVGGQKRLAEVEAILKKWGGSIIFLSRWLITVLGSWVNLASGTARFPWHRFLFWDSLGEITGAVVYIGLGRFFSDRVMSLYAVLGDLTWAIAALLAAIILGYYLLVHLRRPRMAKGATS